MLIPVIKFYVEKFKKLPFTKIIASDDKTL